MNDTEIRIELTGLVGEYAKARATAWAHGLTFVSYKEWLEQRAAVMQSDLDDARKEIDRLRTALQPFADAWLDYEATIDADDETTFEDFTKLRWDWDSVTYNYEKAADAAEGAGHDR